MTVYACMHACILRSGHTCTEAVCVSADCVSVLLKLPTGTCCRINADTPYRHVSHVTNVVGYQPIPLASTYVVHTYQQEYIRDKSVQPHIPTVNDILQK